MSVITHFDSFAKGVLDSKDVIFYVSLIFLGLVFHGALDGIAAVEVVSEQRVDGSATNEIRGVRHDLYPGDLALVAVANVLANRYNKSYDSTSNKRYSLSDQTVKIVKGLTTGRHDHLLRQDQPLPRRQGPAGPLRHLSPKVHVDYVDPDKNPQVARAAGVTKYGTTIVQIGAKKEAAKSMTEEDITGAFIRDMKSNTRTVCFVTGSGERQIDDTDRNGLSHFKDLLGKDELHVEVHQPAGKGGSSRGLHRAGRRRARAAITSSRKSMPSRSMSRAAVAPCSCSIRR